MCDVIASESDVLRAISNASSGPDDLLVLIKKLKYSLPTPLTLIYNQNTINFFLLLKFLLTGKCLHCACLQNSKKALLLLSRIIDQFHLQVFQVRCKNAFCCKNAFLQQNSLTIFMQVILCLLSSTVSLNDVLHAQSSLTHKVTGLSVLSWVFRLQSCSLCSRGSLLVMCKLICVFILHLS